MELTVATSCGDLAVHRWGEDDGRPAALLVHGTGFCGSVWTGVAAHLLDEFVVYAIDRRGHGRSAKPTDAYDFSDFADDAVRVVDALGLEGAYGIGHSAGATDLLLAAAHRPTAFRRLFVIEPTAMDPVAPVRRPELDEPHETTLAGILRRTARFATRDEVLERYRSRDAFAPWRLDLLEAYIEDGFDDLPDGSVTLACTPEIERSMLTRIFAVMAGTYTGGPDGNPFAALGRVPCPTLVATNELSPPIYGHMAADACRHIPTVTTHHFAGVGHTVAQVDPGAVGLVARRFWGATNEAPGRAPC